jgi:hypothetical protein
MIMAAAARDAEVDPPIAAAFLYSNITLFGSI